MEKVCSRHFGLLVISILLPGCVVGPTAPTYSSNSPRVLERAAKQCPEPGTVLPLTKVMNPSFIRDYERCDVVVDATFLKMGNDGYVLGNYDTSQNTTFQILPPGGAPTQSPLGGVTFGVFAGISKSQSDVLFELKSGDPIRLRGAPIGNYDLLHGHLIVGVFHAHTITLRVDVTSNQ